jgi:hypothetical protein
MLNTMKNIALIINTIFISFLYVGCTDLEEEPEGLLAPESFFQTPTDVEARQRWGLDQL